ncbi:Receptor-type guanylate cyclase gcy [Seminavis robusta]|uniref:Receptor-type guanylate cyclase gcy n=1 Tax=Seminavis robusta TaxID=568900 RepID=A0A9N8EAV4_9STRA|nr:Receptor-type guanylate cyclase gcy [Seminavis robusta]|eukprot:Sro876_g214510.1 Receptor-type guanylate cyclase gcy (1211) ;mRNA; f:19860-24934
MSSFFRRNTEAQEEAWRDEEQGKSLEDHCSKESRVEDVSMDLSFTGSSDDSYRYSEDQRDEIKEVEKMAQADTKRVARWRLAATFVLLLTAFSVTFTSYTFLKQEEKNNFETAFDQFSRTVSDAALGQQRDIREALDSLSTTLSAWSNSDKNNESFPFVTLPNWQAIAKNTMNQGHFESVAFAPIVFRGQEQAWYNYSSANINWVPEAHMYEYGHTERLIHPVQSFHPYFSAYESYGTGQFLEETTSRPFYVPFWLFSPPPISYAWLNGNYMANPPLRETINSLLAMQNETLVRKNGRHNGIPLAFSEEEHAHYHSTLKNSSIQNPHGFVYHPVHEQTGNSSSGVAGIISGTHAWDAALLNLLPEGVAGIDVVIRNTCNQTYTYNLVGHDAFFEGEGDFHDIHYDAYEVPLQLHSYSHADFDNFPGHCLYTMHIYPSCVFQQAYDTNTPEIFALIVAITFVCVALAFFIYDSTQSTRNTNLVHKAAQSNAILTSLFPDTIRERLMHQKQEEQIASSKKKGNLKAFLHGDAAAGGSGKTLDGYLDQPMADLFLDVTLLFSDISGFTAWASVREPTQVFLLLESLYGAFDKIAKRRGIFKVETVGDCYVAACGIPTPRPNHSVAMCRFAREVLSKTDVLLKELEVILGPDTADLGLRVGIHSGPVTAGVLRGEKARFQLFGDTVNTCSRLESTSRVGRVHCSKETAEHIVKMGKEAWLERRSDPIALKGKGMLETFWVNVHGERVPSVASLPNMNNETAAEATRNDIVKHCKPLPGLSEKTHRLVDWNVEMLLRILKQIVGARAAATKHTMRLSSQSRSRQVQKLQLSSNPLDEVREIIMLPEFQKCGAVDAEKVKIPADAIKELHHLVSVIAYKYNDNPFHNFDHASHVVMSVVKLMSRIIAPSHLDQSDKAAASRLHDHTYGITSDPLTQFACAFSALIHDLDHSGVSNAQLVKEGSELATKYEGRSVAEQNSLDLAWDLLMQSDFENLRALLFKDESDLVRFRQLVVNGVMSTDIVDKELKSLRNDRWEKAFKSGNTRDSTNAMDMSISNWSRQEEARDDVNRKATIVIEHIIQASDISHTMQHWHVYRKWNQNLFEELYVAYLKGRMDKDPATFWYQGEFGFFDFYIIPLTQKLKDCGVFGVSSDEYLNYAKKNREEWETRGEEVVAEMVAAAREKYGIKAADGSIVRADQEQALPQEDKPVTPEIEC